MKKIGVLVPSSNTTTEPEFTKMNKLNGNSLHFARIPITHSNLDGLLKMNEGIDLAAKHLSDANVDAIAYACTSGSFYGGAGTEKKISNQISLENKKYKLFKINTYKNFEIEINKNKNILKKLLIKIKNQNKKIAGYGAAAKTTTLLNYFNIGNEIIDFIVDDNRLKQKRFTPGTHIPIFSSKELYKKKPDYVILLAWNYSNFIIKTHKKFFKIGGKFIVPLPKIKIITRK